MTLMRTKRKMKKFKKTTLEFVLDSDGNMICYFLCYDLMVCV